MAVKKRAAKKAVSKVEEVKQIVLTQEQWNQLSSVRFTLTTLSFDLESAFDDEDKSIRQVAFEIAKVYKDLLVEQSKLDKIVDATDPDPIEEITWDEDEEEEENN
jgi:hypothetical protein